MIFNQNNKGRKFCQKAIGREIKREDCFLRKGATKPVALKI